MPPATPPLSPAPRVTARADELLSIYDAHLRGASEVQGATRRDRFGPLWRAVFEDRGFVSYESLAGTPDIPALIATTIDYFARIPAITSVEWKTRGHDPLPSLDAALRAHGLLPEDLETVMMGEAATLAADAVALPDDITIRRVDTLPRAERDALVLEACAVATQIFGGAPCGEEMLARLDRMQGLEQFWIAETHAPRRVVSSGRLCIVEGTAIAGIWGGSTLPAWRHRGIYRALTAARARAALAAGVRYIHSDCTAMSRPILERAGLVAITTTTPYVWHRG